MGNEKPSVVLERRDVWGLTRESEWHPLIEWYGRGIAALQAIGASDPRSWLNLANIHGTFTPRSEWPPDVGDRDWNACQHRSWFFLPWHRMYLHHFEKIVRAAIVAEGGPSDWTLLFWNYDPTDPETLALPPACRAETMPDGSPNPLLVERRAPGINSGTPLPAADVETTGWPDVFTADSTVIPTFGGPKTGWTHNGPAFGRVEIEPHGLVHVDVGGRDGNPSTGGYMSFFELAGRDPVFWMHHANVDRLWEVWRNQPGHSNPTDTDWLGAPYSFGSGTWQTTLTVAEVLDVTAPPLLYRYQDVPVSAAEEEEIARVEAKMSAERPPELVGASEVPVPLSDSGATVRIAVRRPAARAMIAEGVKAASERRVFLTLENVTATDLGAGSYTVYVNAPEGDVAVAEDRQVGRMSTFGLMEASQADDVHSGSGATYSYEITDLARRLEEAGEWDPESLRVSVVPTDPEARGGGVRIGRIGIYYG
jgi:tyrosinase